MSGRSRDALGWLHALRWAPAAGARPKLQKGAAACAFVQEIKNNRSIPLSFLIFQKLSKLRVSPSAQRQGALLGEQSERGIWGHFSGIPICGTALNA